ncbi:MAG: aldehyde ferredoxin oxidoreductase family protein [Candidatus Thorarchaeota archaeon]|nr:MAG: aldehyde ferredoxin oxidoreductase family protein [Candidatus Thorarchaeota archaeon]
MFAYRGRILHVDLTSGNATEEPLNAEFARQFVGGAGLGVRMLYEMVDAKTDPLGPENPLIFMTGPFTGTMLPTSGKSSVVSKSPQTGLLGYSTIGGHLGPDIKFAGWDAIVIRGAASEPAFLFVDDSVVELHSADHLWGKDTQETWEILKEETGYRNPGVARIGIAGENLVKYASIIIDHYRAAGRTGLGAVMGSKKLKAIVVHGSNRKVDLAQQERFDSLSKTIHEDRKEDANVRMYGDVGTAGSADMFSAMYGSMPAGYYTVSDFDPFDISGTTVREKILVGKHACYRCPISCGRVIEVKEGKYATGVFAGPELEVTGTMGSLLLNNNLDALAYASKQLDLWGMDTISGGNVVAFAYYLYSEGRITSDDIDGVSPEWGEIDSALILLDKTAKREGVGDLLAEGTLAMGEKFDAVELAAQVNGLETPMHDSRGFSAMAVTYATSPRGACHMNAEMYMWQMGTLDESLGIECKDRFENDADSAAKVQDLRCITNSALHCTFYPIFGDELADLLTLATGWEYKVDDIKTTGERIFTLMRMMNLKLGYDTSGEKLPEILLRPLEGPTESHVPDVDEQLNTWYAHRGWDRRTGKPPKKRLKELGLDELK